MEQFRYLLRLNSLIKGFRGEIKLVIYYLSDIKGEFKVIRSVSVLK